MDTLLLILSLCLSKLDRAYSRMFRDFFWKGFNYDGGKPSVFKVNIKEPLDASTKMALDSVAMGK